VTSYARIPVGEFLVLRSYKPSLSLAQLTFQWLPEFFPGINRPKLEVDYLRLAPRLRLSGVVGYYWRFHCVPTGHVRYNLTFVTFLLRKAEGFCRFPSSCAVVPCLSRFAVQRFPTVRDIPSNKPDGHMFIVTGMSVVLPVTPCLPSVLILSSRLFFS
jgi:hypothetical protein